MIGTEIKNIHETMVRYYCRSRNLLRKENGQQARYPAIAGIAQTRLQHTPILTTKREIKRRRIRIVVNAKAELEKFSSRNKAGHIIFDVAQSSDSNKHEQERRQKERERETNEEN